MAPERSPKRQKTSPSRDTPSKSTLQPSQVPLPPDTPTSSYDSFADTSNRQPQRSSWYSSWSRKAGPATEIARESIRSAGSTAGSTASDVVSMVKEMSSKPRSIRSPSLAMTLGKGRPSRASLVDATTTIVHAEANSPGRRSSRTLSTTPNSIQIPPESTPKTNIAVPSAQIATKSEATENKEEQAAAIQQEQLAQRSSWLGWLARKDETMTDGSTGLEPGPQASEAPSSNLEQVLTESPVVEASSIKAEGEPALANQPARRGWLPIWNSDTKQDNAKGSSSDKAHAEPSKALSDSSKATAEEDVKQIAVQTLQTSPPDPGNTPTQASSLPTLPQDGTKASAWAFWSRERKANESSTSVDRPRDGEIAVSDTPSQDHPRRASISIPKVKEDLKSDGKNLEPKALTSAEKQVDATVKQTKEELAATKSHKKQDSNVTKETVVTTKNSSANATAIEPATHRPESTKSAKANHNLLLPTLEETLKISESPPLLLRLAKSLYVTTTEKDDASKHLGLIKDPLRIKNALAIGVHGYFPTSLIRSVLGQPTGTSIKFADMAAKSIKRWTSTHGYECQVKTAALEGEGKIAERVELLWKLLLNWIEEVRKSDFIMVACHSQGVPVAIMLVAKLIQFGCVSSNARICICAMAGVNMGPFQEYKSRWIGGSAGELFEFSDPVSRVSTDYLAALDVTLKFGVRLTFTGSIDDQLVSLESSLFAPLTHPHIFRAVSIDSRIHAPNFLSHLVGFALKLRNLGVQDHGLIKELSSPLAGSLYTGEGHSRIYEDDAVYDLAVSFAMRTDALVSVPLSLRATVASGGNPYILPFAMRGILEEDVVKNDLQYEVTSLLKEFDEWKPTSKTLKDVKFRLEGIRSQI